MKPFRVVIVDDSALFRVLLRNVLSEIPNCEVVASIGDSRTAIDKVAELKPDLLTLDVEMPEVSGIDILRELKRRQIKTSVVMVSRFTTAGAQVTTDALIEGAFDFILKPAGSDPLENKRTLGDALREKIETLSDASSQIVEGQSGADLIADASPATAKLEAVVIGCSTGGPDALSRVIPDLPGKLAVPVFIVQHMPAGFTASLASRLNEASDLEVLEAEDGMRVRAGQVVMARGGLHMLLARRSLDGVTLKLTDAAREHNCRPAVDYTLRSAVEIYQGKLLAVILTGMGRDGTAGCRLVQSSGGRVLAQHADGCTVYGMPGSVVKAGLANDVVKLPRIATTIDRLVRDAVVAPDAR
mgnify:CR=1 FL=1